MKAVLQTVWAILNLTLSNVYFTFLKEQNMNPIFFEKWINNLSVLNVEYCKCWTLLKITPLIYWACSLKANKRNPNKNRHLSSLTIIYFQNSSSRTPSVNFPLKVVYFTLWLFLSLIHLLFYPCFVQMLCICVHGLYFLLPMWNDKFLLNIQDHHEYDNSQGFGDTRDDYIVNAQCKYNEYVVCCLSMEEWTDW